MTLTPRDLPAKCCAHACWRDAETEPCCDRHADLPLCANHAAYLHLERVS